MKPSKPSYKPTLRVLMSYWYYKDVDIDKLVDTHFPEGLDIFADSGAFSALTQKGTVSLEGYASWLKRYKHRFTAYANLDVIRNGPATWENQQKLEAKGLTPLPVFHAAETWDHLERYLDLGYPYICLGGVANRVQIKHAPLMAWLTRCFKLGKGKAVFHGFGVTSWQVLMALPWYSVDSSSWATIFRFGRCWLFDPKLGCFHQLQLGDKRAWLRHAALVREYYRLDPADFYDRARNNRQKNAVISALSYIFAEEYLRQKWGLIRLPDRDPGGKLYITQTNQGLGYREAGEGVRAYLSETHSVAPERPIYAEAAEAGLNIYRSSWQSNWDEKNGEAELGLAIYRSTFPADYTPNPNEGSKIDPEKLGEPGAKVYMASGDARNKQHLWEMNEGMPDGQGSRPADGVRIYAVTGPSAGGNTSLNTLGQSGIKVYLADTASAGDLRLAREGMES